MTLRVGAVLTRGVHQAASRAGVQLMALYVIYAVCYQTGANGLMAAGVRSMGLPAEAAPSTLVEAPIFVHAILALGGLVLGLYVTLVGLRTLVARERRSIPSWALTRRPIWGMANILVAGILFTIVLTVGFVLLVIPGILAYIAFIFAVVFVADQDVNAVAGFKRSWELSRGHWLRIGLVLLVILGLAIVLGTIASVAVAVGAGIVGIGPGIIGVGSLVIFSPVYVYILAVLAEMYNQLREAESTDDHTMVQL